MTKCEGALANKLYESFARDGLVEFPSALHPQDCAHLYRDLKNARDFGPSLFLTEAEFDADPQYRGTNPRPGRNLLHNFNDKLGFVEENPELSEFIRGLLGHGYVILDKKIVCGIPEKWIPDWLIKRIKGCAVNNLGPYIRPEYRDITYFYGIDYHQDIIDWKSRVSDFITVYVYIHDVSEQDAPLHVLPGSHVLGATVFPHDLNRGATGLWRYRNGEQEIHCQEKKLVGKAGYVGAWHACTLHGTQPDVADSERISLRYLIARDPDVEHAAIDSINQGLRGRLSLEETRVDLAQDGSAAIKRNTINAEPVA